ncbi:hypothetical protein F6B41_12280 [Microbacterium lushaniae]|nr:hypothetical protein F6B41_12280 [Microbacterium lushaniae]
MTNTNTETPRERLERLRTEHAKLTAQTASSPLPVVPGDQFHAKQSGVTFATGGGFVSSGHVSRAGETYTVTQALIDASLDSNGHSWLSIIGDDAAQLERWGAVRFGLGPAAPDAPTWSAVGDPDWHAARDAARAEAWNMPTAEARNAALAAMHAKFGPAPSTATYSVQVDPTIAAAESQQRALNEGGVRFSQYVEAREAGAQR